MSNVVADGKRNIQAGVGYLFWVFARFGYRKFPAPMDLHLGSRHIYARPEGMHSRFPISASHPSPSRPQYANIGWKPFSLVTIAQHYNCGDGNYFDKLRYALSLVNGSAQPSSQTDQTLSATPGQQHAQ